MVLCCATGGIKNGYNRGTFTHTQIGMKEWQDKPYEPKDAKKREIKSHFFNI